MDANFFVLVEMQTDNGDPLQCSESVDVFTRGAVTISSPSRRADHRPCISVRNREALSSVKPKGFPTFRAFAWPVDGHRSSVVAGRRVRGRCAVKSGDAIDLRAAPATSYLGLAMWWAAM